MNLDLNLVFLLLVTFILGVGSGIYLVKGVK